MYEQVLMPDGSPIKVKWNDYPHFTYPWHFHSEIEIVYVIKSYGSRFIGDSFEKFREGDLVLVGSQIPHYWKNDEAFHQGNPELKVNAVVVQFTPDFMDRAISTYPEFAHVRELFVKAEHGVHFSAKFTESIGKSIIELTKTEGFERFILLLKILDAMARTKDYKLLATPNFKQYPLNVKDQRLNKILNYLNLNYTRRISLSQLSNQFGMNSSAFSRYFKEKTGCTLVLYINELRIKYACKLLQNKHNSISHVCFECGFNNLSNFNRFFKAAMKMTPKEYSSQFQ